jgi:DNA (cytosine-5)-methyltransferase 1
MFGTPRQYVNPLADDVQIITARPRPPVRRASTETIGRNEDGDHDNGLDENIEIAEDEIIDLTVDDSDIRRSPLREGDYTVAQIRPSGETITPGCFVEVHLMKFFKYTINFLLVKAIIRDGQGNAILRGIPYTRARNLDSKLPKKLNEVCEILHFDYQGSADDYTLFDAPVEAFVKVRRVIKTNIVWIPQPHPEFRDIRDHEERKRVVEALGTLFCRWQFTIISVTQRNVVKPVEEVLRRYTESEIELQHRENDGDIRAAWRNERMMDGNQEPSRAKYTLFDSFSGAGGVSRGAQMAGFRVSHAIDSASEVWGTYQTNFPDVNLFRGAIDQYIQDHRRQVRADVLHLSPPCQYFSPAHTHEGINDDENKDALLACGTLIDKIRPRLITLEQTFGLTHDQHNNWFRTLIHDCTQLGYSIRWKVVRLCTWGSAQDRKRLIMIGAAPGEKLPPFPKATHSEHGRYGTKKFNTIGKAIAGLRPGYDLHDIEFVRRYNPPRQAYDPNRLSGTLTTAGTTSCYPDGTRDFTLRELASLQGFPKHHRFQGGRTCVKRQIGNAFPPNTVQVLYEHLKAWLVEQDGRAIVRHDDIITLDGPDLHANDFIIIDDSDDDSISGRLRGISAESSSADSDASLRRDIQDVLDDDEDVVMIDQCETTIDLTAL